MRWQGYWKCYSVLVPVLGHMRRTAAQYVGREKGDGYPSAQSSQMDSGGEKRMGRPSLVLFLEGGRDRENHVNGKEGEGGAR